MSSVNYSEIKPQIYNYLGFHNIAPDSVTDEMITECLRELENVVHFRYIHRIFETPPEFLKAEPYREFLSGCTGVILSVTTLGAETDKRIKYLARTDMTKSVISDAAASAYLEYLSDMHEKTLGDNLTYRFCPGYGGSSVTDLKHIFKLLQPEKIGVTVSDTCFMLPEKTMAGVLGIGKSCAKTCKGCFMLPDCNYLKEGTRCYGSEKK